MNLRPSSARWFELVVPKRDAGDAMEALARHGEVQFDWSGGAGAGQTWEPLHRAVERYRALFQRYSVHWPPPEFAKRCCDDALDVVAESALQRLEHWCQAAAPALESLESLRDEIRQLELWRSVLAALGDSSLDLRALAGSGPVLAGVCLLLSEREPQPDLAALVVRVRLGELLGYLGLVPRQEVQALSLRARELGGECLPVPDWLHATAAQSLEALDQRAMEGGRRIREQERLLARSAEEASVALSCGVLERLDWLRQAARHIDCDAYSCWISGWTSATSPEALDRVLREVGIESRVQFAAPPADARAPTLSPSPPWLRPYDVFTHAAGTPAPGELNPTAWVAVLVPLMFGYMCGDVGHGLVIVAVGLLLRRRTDLWPILVYCGLASTGFGFVYGGLFGFEQLLDPLWVRPLEHPYLLLGVAVAGGALVLTLGILLHLVQTCWSGQGRSQGVADAAQLLVYWGLLLSVADMRLAGLAVVGVLLCGANRLWRERSFIALLKGLGRLVESTFTLLLNTLSFVRVGAFALAHAALESVIMTLADAVSGGGAHALVIVLGNLVVVVIEGLLVSIQTTRLVLFEFFVRFFEGRGRRFEPVAGPSHGARGSG
jgi:V/A-type H+-transporting ATPase subunit I